MVIARRRQDLLSRSPSSCWRNREAARWGVITIFNTHHAQRERDGMDDVGSVMWTLIHVLHVGLLRIPFYFCLRISVMQPVREIFKLMDRELNFYRFHCKYSRTGSAAITWRTPTLVLKLYLYSILLFGMLIVLFNKVP